MESLAKKPPEILSRVMGQLFSGGHLEQGWWDPARTDPGAAVGGGHLLSMILSQIQLLRSIGKEIPLQYREPHSILPWKLQRSRAIQFPLIQFENTDVKS